MADNADWRNPQQTYTNSPDKKGMTTHGGNAIERKFENLESNVPLGNESQEKVRGFYKTVPKSQFGTNASWTAQAAMAKIDNKYGRVDTFKKKQE